MEPIVTGMENIVMHSLFMFMGHERRSHWCVFTALIIPVMDKCYVRSVRLQGLRALKCNTLCY